MKAEQNNFEIARTERGSEWAGASKCKTQKGLKKLLAMFAAIDGSCAAERNLNAMFGMVIALSVAVVMVPIIRKRLRRTA